MDEEKVYQAPPSYMNTKVESNSSRVDLLLNAANGEINLNNIAVMKSILLSMIDRFKYAVKLYNELCKHEKDILIGNINGQRLLDCINDIGVFAEELYAKGLYRDENFIIYPIRSISAL